MRRKHFKGSIELLLVIIQMLLIVILGSEVDDLKIFYISKILILTLFIINHRLLCKYGYIIRTLQS